LIALKWTAAGEPWWADDAEGQGEKLVIPADVVRRCERIVAALNVPTPLDMSAVRAEVSRITGRPIEVRVTDMPSRGLCGLWASIDGTDVIWVTAGSSSDHQQHVQLHELGHLLAGHEGTSASMTEVLRELAPDLDPALVEAMLARKSYDTVAEIEAELLATMIGELGTRWIPPRPEAPGAVAEVLRRIEHDLGRS
jgi:hypothetical protein